MQVCLFVEPQQGATPEQVRDLAIRAEELGVDGFFRSDHVLPPPRKHYLSVGLGGQQQTDAFTTMSIVAASTTSVKLGVLVVPATFRSPAHMLLTWSDLTSLSTGRFECGFGAGWNATEHAAYSTPFPGTAERMALLDEYLALLTSFRECSQDEEFVFTGSRYSARLSPAQFDARLASAMRIIVGGRGDKVIPALAGKYADELNVPFLPPPETLARFERAMFSRTSERPLELSVVRTIGPVDGTADIPHDRLLAHEPDAVVQQIEELKLIGVSRIYLQLQSLADLDNYEVQIRQVLRHSRPQC